MVRMDTNVTFIYDMFAYNHTTYGSYGYEPDMWNVCHKKNLEAEI